MRLLGTIFIHCECEETKAKINARHARTSPIKASRKHDSSSGRKGTNISILPSRIAISAVMMSLPLPCFAKKTLLLVVIDSSLRNRTKVGSQSDIRYVLCAMLLQKVWSWCMCGFLWVWLPLRNSLSVQKTEKHPLKGSSLSSPQVPTPENLADKSDFKIGPNILKLLCNNKHAMPTREPYIFSTK